MQRQAVGREREFGEIEDFLARGSAGAALALEGEPGIGKTTLWREGCELARARGMRVLVARAAASETPLSFAGLGDLLEGVGDDVLAGIPGLQRRALEAALLRGDDETPPAERRAVATGCLSVLRLLAAAGPVLLAVDDAHWLDGPTAATLAFALRRLERDPVRILTTARAGAASARTFDRSAVDRRVLQVGPLTTAALHELLKERLGRSFVRPTLLRIAQASNGNPFYALEIARELPAGGQTHPGEAIPVPADLREVVLARLRRLPAETREALLRAAAVPHPTTALVDERLLEAAVEIEVVRIGGDRAIAFGHPLYASAIYGSASPRRRRELHRELAEIVDDAEERARHLALAVETPSEEVAAALEQGAAQARGRGAPAAAAELLERAVVLTPDEGPARTLRVRTLAEARFESGDTLGARAALEELTLRLDPGRDRAEALLLLATIAWFEEQAAAEELAERALSEAAGDRRLQALARARLAWMAGGVRRRVEHGQAALELLDEDEDPALYAFALLNWAEARFQAGHGPHAVDIARGRALQGSDMRWEHSTIPACWAKEMDELHDARAQFEEYGRRAAEQGDESSLTQHLVHLAELSLWLGEWKRAEDEARQSLALAEQTGQRALEPVALYATAIVDAHLGRVDLARAQLERAGNAVDDLDRVFVDAALGFVALSLDDHGETDAHLSRADRELRARGYVDPARWRFHPDHVEAVVALGDLACARELLERLRGRAAAAPRPWVVGATARCEALLAAALGDLEPALAFAADAAREHEAVSMPFELGRTLLVQGRIERRAKRRAAAKQSLERALAIFEELGAPLWSAKAAAELARVGVRRAPDELTESERRVAELAASGLTNREVAAQLFMSPKTVEANLARAYRKLDVGSRAELGARLAAREPAQT